MSQFYSIGEASKKSGVTIKTIREWDKLGKIRTIKTPGRAGKKYLIKYRLY